MQRILPNLSALITQRPRQKVSIKWSSSWTYNAFRVWEILFWAPVGIRSEGVTDSKGNHFSFTLENWLATLEGVVRAYFKRSIGFRIVLVPQMELAGMTRQYGIPPYRFAIAFDATANATGGSGSISFSHTVTGTDPFLVVFPWGPITDVSGVTAVTYNSVAMTLLNKDGVNDINRWLYSYIKMAPSTGANTVAITAVGSDATYGVAVSYSGVAQTGQPDANNMTKASAVTSVATSVTVVASNCWIVAAGNNEVTAQDSMTGTFRSYYEGTNAARQVKDSNTTVATGVNTYTQTWTGSGYGAITAISFSPAAEVETTSRKALLALMGAGQ